MNTTISETLTKATDFAKTRIAEWNDRSNISIVVNYPPTELIKAQAQYGAENIFMLSSDYHGRYEDDDCYFTYYNNVTGEEFKDTWSTRFAAPPFGWFETITLHDAFENDLVNKEVYLEYLKKKVFKYLEVCNPEGKYIDPEKYVKYLLPVRVEGGRKFKGEGILVSIDTKTYTFGPTYGKGYNQSSTSTAKIYVPETNTFAYCSANYCKFYTLKDLYNEWVAFVTKQVTTLTVNDVFDTQNSWMDNNHNLHIMTFEKYLESYVNPYKYVIEALIESEKQLEIANNLYKEAREIENLEKWVREHMTDVPDSNVYDVAVRIYRKRNK